MAQRLRVFVSSPGDVPAERLRAALVIDKLAQDYSRFFMLESYRWEHEPMLASGHFQDAIAPPSAHDIVLLILWSRLGTPLPERTAVREYRGIDGRVPVTGTEWEYEDALQAARERGAPDILAFRNISDPAIPIDPQARVRSLAQLEALDAFWQRHFADRGVFLAAYEQYKTIEEFAQRLEQALRKLIERRIAALARDQTQTEPLWTGAPFRGLEAYEFEHAPIFFGRDGLVARAAEQLAAQARAGTAFLLVCGPSGSGKSSLVKAALVPRLMKPQRISGAAFLRRVVFRPGDHPNDVLLGLAEALTRGAVAEGVGLPELLGPGQDAHTLAVHLRAAVDAPGYVFAGALGRVTQEERQRGRVLAFEEAKLILIVDQLEELFTLPGISAEDRHLLIRLLAGLARAGAVWVVATLRADFWHRAAEIPDMMALAQGQGRLDIAVPAPAELAEIIRKPAQAAGLSFESHPETGIGLDAVLTERAAAEPGVLPLLSFTLDELYRRDITEHHGHVLTYTTYEALGGLEGAIATRADQTVAALTPAAQAALPLVLRTLATVATGTDHVAVARAAPLDSFPPGSEAREVVEALTAARLLVASNEGTTPTVRFAHEALLSHWQRARDQLANDGRDLETRALIEQQRKRWQDASGRAQRQLLLRDPDLAKAVDLDRRWADEIDADTRAFIQASRRRARRQQQLAGVAAIVFGLVAVVAVYARQQAISARQQAETQTRLANQNLAEALVEKGLSLFEQRNFYASYIFGAKAFDLDPTSARAHSLAYLSAMSAPYMSKNILVGHKDRVWSIAFSPDERILASAAGDKTVRLWRLPEGTLLATLSGHEDSVQSVAFSPDGRTLASAAGDKTVRLWRLPEGTPLATLSGHKDRVQSVAFSPDERTLASAGADGTVRLWRLPEGTLLATLSGHEDSVQSVAFSPDGRTLASAAGDKTVRLWRLPEGTPLVTLSGHKDRVQSVAFSPDERTLASAGADGTVRLWRLPEGTLLGTLSGQERSVQSVAFSPDGRTLASAAGDKTVRLWRLPEGIPLATLSGHEDSVQSVAFSPDGRTLASAANDKTVRLWRLPEDTPLTTLSGSEDSVQSVAFSPDERTLASAGADGTVRLWRLPEGTLLATLSGHEDMVWSVAFSPDGRTLASGAGDKTVRLWRLPEGTPLATLSGPLADATPVDWVLSMAFSPDGRTLASAANDKTVRLWRLPEGTPLGTLSGHEGWVMSVAFSPDGRTLASAGADGTVRLWRLPEGTLLGTLSGHEGWVMSVAFSPDGRTLASAGADGTVRLWRLPEGTLLGILSGHEDMVWSVAFSPDGRTLASAAGDKTVRLWRLPEGTPLATLSGHEGRVPSVAFSPDGRTLASAADDKTVRLWPQMAFFSLSPKALYRQAQLDTNRRVEGLVAETLSAEARQVLKEQKVD